MPATFAQLGNLRHLSLNHNQLTELGEIFTNMNELGFFRPSHNPLIRLPDSIRFLDELHELHLDEAEITSLPDAVGDMKMLSDLHLRGSKIKELPKSLARTKCNVYIKRTNLTEVPRVLVEGGMWFDLKIESLDADPGNPNLRVIGPRDSAK